MENVEEVGDQTIPGDSVGTHLEKLFVDYNDGQSHPYLTECHAHESATELLC